MRIENSTMRRSPRCKICRAEIVEPLVEVSPASDWLCLECSGVTLGDLVDEDEYAENEIEMRRLFHGKRD